MEDCKERVTLLLGSGEVLSGSLGQKPLILSGEPNNYESEACVVIVAIT